MCIITDITNNHLGRLELEEKARNSGLHTYIIGTLSGFALSLLYAADAGRTQVQRGSKTVLAIFGEVSQVDTCTGHLKLL